jgi:N-acetylmuramoyl-L-alanine amidase
LSNTSIIVCGEKFDIGTRVVLWGEDKGFNGYDRSQSVVWSQNRKTGKKEKLIIKGVRYNRRNWRKNPKLNHIQSLVNQFFLHHSGLYRAADTFNVLHNQRRLSVHFILDDSGLIYQTLDLKEKAWHGGQNNTMSVGIEIDSRAHAGRFPDAYDEYHCKKYGVMPRRKRIDLVQKSWTTGYEYNDKQYEALIRLAIGLKNIFPKMNPMDFPRDKNGRIIKHIISEPKKHSGVICHYNNSTNKNDPISFDDYRFLKGVKENNPLIKSTFLTIETIREKQELLQRLGYNPGPVDGLMGSKTERAIKSFQKDVGLVQDGDWGNKTTYMIDLVLKEKGLV